MINSDSSQQLPPEAVPDPVLAAFEAAEVLEPSHAQQELREYRMDAKHEETMRSTNYLLNSCKVNLDSAIYSHNDADYVASKGGFWSDSNLRTPFYRRQIDALGVGVGLAEGQILQEIGNLKMDEVISYPIGDGAYFVVKKLGENSAFISHTINVDGPETPGRKEAILNFAARAHEHEAGFDASIDEISKQLANGEAQAYADTSYTFASNRDELLSLI